MNLSKKEIRSLIGDGIQYRCQNMWNPNLVSDKPKEIHKMNNDSKEIIDLGRQHGQQDMAMEAVSNGESLSKFRSDLLAKVSNDSAMNLARLEGSHNYSVTRAIKGQLNNDLDGLEAEYHQEMTHQRGKLGDGKLYVNTRAMTGSNSSFLKSTYAQDVVHSMKESGLYSELGVRVENVPDGKLVYPRESAFPTASMVDLNNSNSISASDPTLDSISLEAKQLASLTVLARNLLAQESVGLENYVQESLLRAMNRELDKQILVGSGSGANFNGAVNSAGNAETYSGSMAIADLIGAITKVQADGINVSGCAFVMNPAEYATFINTERTSGNGKYVVEPMLSNDSFMVGHALGVPVYVNDQVTAGQAIFGDFSRSVVAFHGGGQIIELDPYYDFAKGSVAIRLIEDTSFGLLNANAFCSIKSA